MKRDPNDDYAVGYGRPPLHGRFRKGQSGNPKGRPKGSLNLDTLLTRVLNEQVVITTGGRRRRVSKLEVVVTQMVNKAASGDLRAAQQVLALEQALSGRGYGEPQAPPSIAEADRRIIAGLQRRLARMDPSEDEDAGSEPA